MPMKPTNLNFPCHFSYKGWEVSIINETAQSTIAEVQIKAEIIPNKPLLEHELAKSLYDDMHQGHQTIYLEDTNTFSNQQHKDKVEQLKKIKPLVNQFCEDKSNFSYCCKFSEANIDRYTGDSLNLVNMAKANVIHYIDEKLGNVKDDFYSFIHKGVKK